jgi:hypothetical protein
VKQKIRTHKTGLGEKIYEQTPPQRISFESTTKHGGDPRASLIPPIGLGWSTLPDNVDESQSTGFVEFEMDEAMNLEIPFLSKCLVIRHHQYQYQVQHHGYYQVHRLFNVERLLKIVHYCCDYTIDKRRTIRNYY